MLRNGRHERFAQNYASGMSRAEAYLAAGYNGKPVNAAQHAERLLKDFPEINERINEIFSARRAEAAQASREALNELRIEKKYVLQAAVDTLEIALARKKLKKTRSSTFIEDVDTGKVDAGGAPIISKEMKVRTVDFEGYAGDLPVASKMVELLGREHNLFIETKNIRTGPLDDMPEEDLGPALNAIREAIAKQEEAAGVAKPAD